MRRYRRYPEHRDSGVEWIGSVPEGWAIRRLKQTAAFSNSTVDKKAYDGQESVRLCNYTDVYNNEFIASTMPFMEATASEREIEQFALRRGDVLMTKDSEDPTDIGIAALVPTDMPRVICGYHLAILRPSTFDFSRFLHRWLQAQPTKGYFFVEAPGLTRYGLGLDAIGNTPVCVPPASEQTAIAAAIDRETARIDALIARKTRFIELLQEKRQALITHAVTKGLDPNVRTKDSGVEWIGRVPEHWRVCALGYSARVAAGGTPDRQDADFWNGDIPWVKTGEINYGVITATEETISRKGLQNSAAFVAGPGTVLVAMYGMGVTRGRVAVLGIPAAFNQACSAVSCGPSLLSRFTFYALWACYRYLRDLANAASQANLSSDIIKRLKLPTPNLDTQVQIAKFLDTKLAILSRLEEQAIRSITLLKERRSAFITAAVTGQIDLREPASQTPETSDAAAATVD